MLVGCPSRSFCRFWINLLWQAGFLCQPCNMAGDDAVGQSTKGMRQTGGFFSQRPKRRYKACAASALRTAPAHRLARPRAVLIRIAPSICWTFSAVSTRKSALHKEDLECETVPQTQRLSLGSSFRYFLADRVGTGGRENNAIDCIQVYWLFRFVNPFRCSSGKGAKKNTLV